MSSFAVEVFCIHYWIGNDALQKNNTEQFYLPLRNGYPIHDDHVELQLSLTKLLHNIVYMRGYLSQVGKL